jgi:hypothetical protein
MRRLLTEPTEVEVVSDTPLDPSGDQDPMSNESGDEDND